MSRHILIKILFKMNRQSQHSCLKYQILSSKSKWVWRTHILASILHSKCIIFIHRLVDSRDIAELRLKQSDCEILIRKKEALQPIAPSSLPPPLPYAMLPSPPPPATSAAPASAPAPALPAPAKANTSSHPPLKSPMAGTFYRCPGPGEPPFVKVSGSVGDHFEGSPPEKKGHDR